MFLDGFFGAFWCFGGVIWGSYCSHLHHCLWLVSLVVCAIFALMIIIIIICYVVFLML